MRLKIIVAMVRFIFSTYNNNCMFNRSAVEWFNEMFRYCNVEYNLTDDGAGYAKISEANILEPRKVQHMINNRFGKPVARINPDGSITVKLTE